MSKPKNEFRSMRLNCAIRADIQKTMSDSWVKNNPSPADMEKEEHKVGDAIYQKLYGKLNFSGIPKEFLTYRKAVKVSIAGTVKEFKMSEKMPLPKAHNYSDPVLFVFDKEPSYVTKYHQLADAYDTWSNKLSEFNSEIYTIVHSVTTTGQLVELWPESFQYIPAYAANPSVINLPALKTSRLNEALGIKP